MNEVQTKKVSEFFELLRELENANILANVSYFDRDYVEYEVVNSISIEYDLAEKNYETFVDDFFKSKKEYEEFIDKVMEDVNYECTFNCDYAPTNELFDEIIRECTINNLQTINKQANNS